MSVKPGWWIATDAPQPRLRHRLKDDADASVLVPVCGAEGRYWQPAEPQEGDDLFPPCKKCDKGDV